jgi:DNA-binding NtrC family response regulator
LSKQITYDQRPSDLDYGPTVLIVDDESHGRNVLKLACKSAKESDRLRVIDCATIAEAIKILSETPVHVVLLDKTFINSQNGDLENGIKAIPQLLRIQPYTQILMVTGSNDLEDMVEAMSNGAFNYVVKEAGHKVLIAQINKAIDVANLTLEKFRLDKSMQNQVGSLELAGQSPAMQKLRMRTQAVAKTNSTVLLLGQSGTGKTATARLINDLRKQFLKQTKRPFVEVNIGAFASNLVERELFGHEDGAYTGAGKTKPGFFELANNGTIFLDEIGEASLEIQGKLLKVIEDGKLFRVGGNREIHSSFQLICATNEDLEALIAQGRFREDLYMRISTFVIQIPKLDERKEDIPAIIETLLPRCCREVGVFVKFNKIPKGFIEYLMNNPVRGNIRGIYQQLCRVLAESDRDSQGYPIFLNWPEIVGAQGAVGAGAVGGKRKSINLYELANLPLDVVGPGFPGIGTLIESIKDRIFLDAMSKMKKNREIAGALKLAESATYTRIQKIRSHQNGTSVPVSRKPKIDDERPGAQ